MPIISFPISPVYQSGDFAGIADGSSTSAWGNSTLDSYSGAIGWTHIFTPTIIIEDGHPGPAPMNPLIGSEDSTETLKVLSDGARHWLRVNVRSAKGQLWLVSNPVYLNS